MKFMNQWDGKFHNYQDGEPDGTGDTGTPTFVESLPEDLRGNAALANFKDAGSLAKSFVEMKSMQGSSIRIPSKEASEEDIKAFNDKLIEQMPSLMYKPNFDDPEQSTEFYRTLGKPSDAKEYEIPTIEGVEMPEERGEALRQIALEADLTKAQFNKVMEATLKIDAEAMAASAANLEAEAKELHSEWGMAYDQNKQTVLNVAKHTGAPDRLIEAIGNDAAGVDTMNWILKMSNLVKGEGINVGEQLGGKQTTNKDTPAEARAKISEINANKKHPYWNQADPAHKDALATMVKLQEMAKAS